MRQLVFWVLVGMGELWERESDGAGIAEHSTRHLPRKEIKRIGDRVGRHQSLKAGGHDMTKDPGKRNRASPSPNGI